MATASQSALPLASDDTLRDRVAESLTLGVRSMARRRYQTGSVFKRGKKEPVFVGRYREDEVQADGSIQRVEKKVVLGTVKELRTQKNASRALEPFLRSVNSIDYRPSRFGKISEFSEVWEREVLQHQKPSSVKAAQSHLRAYIRPWLGEMRLEEFTIQAQQLFATRLSKCVSRKTAQNVLGTVSSMLRTAKAWSYCCTPIDFGQLALPAETISKPARFFTEEQVAMILAVSQQPFRTMFAIAAYAGLRAGEVMGLQRSDIDFDARTIHVRRSAWYGKLQTVKNKTSRATVAMSSELANGLRDFLASWTPNALDLLFATRRGTPHSANKIVQRALWPVLDQLKISRAGFHAFRHFHASALLHVGADPKVAQEQMRHADPRVTLESYAHVIGDAQQQAVERVAELIRKNAANCAQMRPN